MPRPAPHELLSSLRASYVESLPGKIDEIELNIMALERANNDEDEYKRLFRNIHNLKGSGATFGFNILTTACHQMEDCLNNSSGTGSLDYEALLSYVDILKRIVELITRDERDFTQIEAVLADVKKRLNNERLHGLVVDVSNTGIVVLKQTLSEYPVSLSFETDGLRALQRLLHEKFDFVIASKELDALNGLALIGALHLNQGINCDIPSALITSDKNIRPNRDGGPKCVIHKDARFNANLHAFMAAVLKEA